MVREKIDIMTSQGSIPRNRVKIVREILTIAKEIVETITEPIEDYILYPTSSYVAGGFAAFADGLTTTFGDVNIFILSGTLAVAGCRFIYKGYIFTVSILDNNFNNIKDLLAVFDLDICRRGFILHNDEITITRVHIPDTCSQNEYRLNKYAKRLRRNTHRRRQSFIWKPARATPIDLKTFLAIYDVSNDSYFSTLENLFLLDYLKRRLGVEAFSFSGNTPKYRFTNGTVVRDPKWGGEV